MKPITLIFPITIWMLGCSHAPEEAAPKPVVTVKIARAQAEDIKLTVQTPATIFPREQANISARITAPIRSLRVRKGDRVATGQVLAVLESRDIVAQCQEASANLADAQANLQKTSSGTLPTDVGRAKGQLDMAQAARNQAQKNYDRRSQLFKQGAIPERDLLVTETDLAQAKTAYDVAKKSLDLLQNQSGQNDIRIGESRVAQAKAKEAYANAQLQYTDLRSPLSGTVTEQFMYPGDMAKPELPIFTVMDLSTAIARAQVPEQQAARVRKGQACGFTQADGSGEPVWGKVTVINQAVDPARRTVEVWCEIRKTKQNLRSGVFGNVQIATGTVENGVVVPLTAVQFAEGTQNGSVMAVDAKQIAHKKDIETGQKIGGKVQVLKGLDSGETVIVEGGYGLPDGTQVQVAGGGK